MTDGEAKIERFAPGCYRLEIDAGPESIVKPVVVRIIEEQESKVEAETSPGTPVMGMITDETGRPVPEADIRLWPRGRITGFTPLDDHPGVRVSKSDNDGRYQLPAVDTGDFVMTVAGDDLLPAFAAITVLRAEREIVKQIVLLKGFSVENCSGWATASDSLGHRGHSDQGGRHVMGWFVPWYTAGGLPAIGGCMPVRPHY